MSSQEEQQFDKATKDILVKLVTALLCDKPKDPVRSTARDLLILPRYHTSIHTCWTCLRA